MTLPKWVEERWHSVIPIEEEDIIKALAVAVEALEKIKALGRFDDAIEAKDALAQIKKMG